MKSVAGSIALAAMLLTTPAYSVTIEGPITPRSSKYEVDSDLTKWIAPMLKRKLKDPESARLRNVVFVRKNSMRAYFCGEMNARNSFGGYTGWEPFYVFILRNGAGELDGWDVATPADWPGGRYAFQRSFDEACEQ